MIETLAAQSWVAFEKWRHAPRMVRRALLHRWSEGVSLAAEELARLLTQETGKPITLSRGEVQRGLITIQATEEALAIFGEEAIPYDLMAGAEGCKATLQRIPRGPVLAITPFNFPVNLALHKLAPAIGAPLAGAYATCDGGAARTRCAGVTVTNAIPSAAQRAIHRATGRISMSTRATPAPREPCAKCVRL